METFWRFPGETIGSYAVPAIPESAGAVDRSRDFESHPGSGRRSLVSRYRGWLWALLFSLLFAAVIKTALSEPAPLPSLNAIESSSTIRAGNHLPVAFEATVTYDRAYERTLFVQDNELGIFVLTNGEGDLQPGDRVLVRGMAQGSFRPIVVSSQITVLEHGRLPTAVPASFDQLIHGDLDSRLVKVRGQIRAADISYSSDRRAVQLNLATVGGEVDAVVDAEAIAAFKKLLDSDVEVTGVAGARFDGKMNQVGVILHVSSPTQVNVLRPAGHDPWSLPITPMSEVLTHYHVTDSSQRVHVQGTITYQQIGSAVVIQSKDRSLWVNTDENNMMKPGDLADVTGFPDVQNGSLVLNHGDILDRYWPSPVQAQPVHWQDLAKSQHVFDLVTIHGKVVTAVREPTQDNFILSADGHLFSAVIRRRAFDNQNVAGLKEIASGSRVQVTGVCVPGDSNPYNPDVPFNILMRSPDDIVIIARPSLLNQTNLLRVIGALLLLILLVAGWGWTLRRRVRRQTNALAARIEAEAALQRRIAHLEQRRRRIIEEINGDVPLGEILEQIAETTSLHLDDAPCWFEAANGKRHGQVPARPETLRLLQTPILAPAGPPLGIVCAAVSPDVRLETDINEALTEAARVAALAIETRRLYADLRHRSDFDQLTDLHNRSSLERHLDRLLEQADHTGAMFALIYIDLDKFKQINDHYGHHIGDLYLQESTRRMKKQLRAVDLLARLGGDEFVALVPDIRERSEAEEIARRLEYCFHEEFLLGNFLIRGSASFGISMYPMDGTTRHALLQRADAVMYDVKHSKPQNHTLRMDVL